MHHNKFYAALREVSDDPKIVEKYRVNRERGIATNFSNSDKMIPDPIGPFEEKRPYSSALNKAFWWTDSPEGTNYWRRISDILLTKANKDNQPHTSS